MRELYRVCSVNFNRLKQSFNLYILLTGENNRLNRTFNIDHIFWKAYDKFNLFKTRFNKLKKVNKTTQDF